MAKSLFFFAHVSNKCEFYNIWNKHFDFKMYNMEFIL